MGNANSRQKLTQPFRNALVALLERTRIRDGFQILLERIKGITGFHKKQPQTEPTSSPGAGEPVILSYQAGLSDHRRQEQKLKGKDAAEANLAEHGNVTSPDQRVCSSTSTAKTTEDDRYTATAAHVPAEPDIQSSGPNSKPPSTDLEAHLPQSDNQMEDENGDENSIVSNIKEAIEEAVPILAIRKAYETKMQALDAVYSRLILDPAKSLRPERSIPQSAFSEPIEPLKDRSTPNAGSSPGPDDQKNPTIDRWIDTEAAEYVFSSMKVALPDGELPNSDMRITFQRSQSVDTPVHHATAPIDSPEASEPIVDVSRKLPSRTLWNNDEVEALANYHWHKPVYMNLPLGQDSIRLVDIQPGQDAGDVCVLIAVHSLDKVAMKYEALSYVWGDPNPAKHITVNGRNNVPINPNLFDTIVSLRRTDTPRRIWIDALCLNQESPAEKSKQVQKMGKIYGLAKTVNVFLGVSSSSDSSSIETLFQFLENADSNLGNESPTSRTFEGLCEVSNAGPDEVCKGFVELSLQPWWGRIWTLQEFYLAKNEPVWYWGRAHVNNILFKKHLSWLSQVLERRIARGEIKDTALSDIESNALRGRSFRSFRVDVERAKALIWRRYNTDGFDSPIRLYRELAARATNPRDFIYGLRAIFDPVFGKVFIPDYQMPTELLFACLAVFLIQFECWGDVLWYYPARFQPGNGGFPSWLPDFTKHIQPHELDVQPLDEVEKAPTPKMVVMNHRLHAEGYVLDKIYGHRHLDQDDGQRIFEELWQYDHALNNNHECHEYFLKAGSTDDVWLKVLRDMYESFYAKWTHFNSAFRGAVLQSTMSPAHADKLPRQVAECAPQWDILQWVAFKTIVRGLSDIIPDVNTDIVPGCLENIFSPRMYSIFRHAFADFFIGAIMFDWKHLEVWLDRFLNARQWSSTNTDYWSGVRDSLSEDMTKRAQLISDAYASYAADIWPEISRFHWCYPFYYTFLAYVVLLDCDDYARLEGIITQLKGAAVRLFCFYIGNADWEIRQHASLCPSIAARMENYNTIIDIFRGRYYVWTDGGFRGISCPGVESCCDKKSIVAIVDGLSFPVIVRDYDEATGEGWLAGCAVIRGVNMLGMDTEEAELPPDYQKGEKRVFKFR